MKKLVTNDGGATYTLADAGFGDVLLGGLTNPFTGTPSTQSQQWMTFIYAFIIGVVCSALFFKNSRWYKNLAGKEITLNRQDANRLAEVSYGAGRYDQYRVDTAYA